MTAATFPIEWSPKQVERLKELWALGWTCSKIAEDLGTTASSISGKKNRLRLADRVSPISNHATYHPKKEKKEQISKRSKKSTPMKALAPSPDPYMLKIEQLTPATCRFPIGDPRLPSFGFCGHKTEKLEESEGHRVYCPYHRTIAYSKPSTGETNKRVENRAEFFSKINQRTY